MMEEKCHVISCNKAGAKDVKTTSLHAKCEAETCPLVAADSIAPEPLHVSRLVVNDITDVFCGYFDFMSAEVEAAIFN